MPTDCNCCISFMAEVTNPNKKLPLKRCGTEKFGLSATISLTEKYFSTVSTMMHSLFKFLHQFLA